MQHPSRCRGRWTGWGSGFAGAQGCACAPSHCEEEMKGWHHRTHTGRVWPGVSHRNPAGEEEVEKEPGAASSHCWAGKVPFSFGGCCWMGSGVQAGLCQRLCCGTLNSPIQSCLQTDSGVHSHPFLEHLL